MYCLEKFQRELAYFLDIDLRDLPKVQEILKAQGYTAVKKNDEIIELGGARQSFLEKIKTRDLNYLEKEILNAESIIKGADIIGDFRQQAGSAKHKSPTSTANSTTNNLKWQQDGNVLRSVVELDNTKVLQINADEAIAKLHSTQGQPIPQEIDIQTFKNVLESIENQDNFITHLQKKQDAQSRLAYLNLVEPTLKEWDIKLTKGDRKELIKVFNDGDNFFTLLITEQDNKRLITFIPKARDGYIESKIKNADLIQTFTSRASESKAEWTRVANSTTNNLKWQQDGNLKATQTFEVELHEAEQLQKHFNFKNKKPLLRELRENEIAHALKSHGDETKESQRGNIAITRADIEANYPRITQEYDEQFFTDKSVIYVKQINGYHIAIEEALLGQDKLIFKSLWKTKGNYNKEVLLKNAKANPYPHNADEVAKSESISNPSLEQGYPQQYHLSNTNSTTNNLKWQQDGNVLRSVVELDNGEKLLLSKDRLENIYIQSNHIEQVNSYDELILQESLEKFAKDELENKLAKQIESYRDTSPMAQYDKVDSRNLKADMLEKIGANKTISADESLNALQTFNATDKDIIPQKPTKAQSEYFNPFMNEYEKITSEAPPSKINFTYTTGEAKGIAELRKDLKQALEPSLNKEIVNKEQGLSGVITTEEVKKIMSKKAVDKSIVNGFTRDEHIEVAKHIERLFTESKLLRSHKDYKENPNILQVHRFVKDIEVNGKEANALITLFEKMQGKNKIYTIELESLENLPPLSTQAKSAETAVKAQSAAATPTEAAPIAKTDTDIIPQNPTKAQSEYFNPFMNEYEKIKEIKKLHTQDDVLVRVMKINDRYIEPLSNMSVSKEYLQKQTAQSLKEQITQAILGNQTQLKALQQGYNTYHLSPFQKEILESALDMANNPIKYKEYKLQGLQKQLDNLNSRYAKDREELEKEISALKGESSLESAPQKVDSSDIVFTDKKGKEHTLTKEVQEQWLNTFNLKSLDEAYTPKFSDEVSKALEPILQGEQIKLTSGSLLKLMQRDRLEFLPYIKDTLEYSDIVIKDKENALIFAKDIGQTSYFTSVSKNDKGEWVISTNSYKTINQLKNRVNDSGEILYISKEAPNILAETFTTKAFSNELASDIIPQQTLNGDSITNPDISYAIKNENITKELVEKIANGEIDNIRKQGDINIADVSYYDKDNMTMYSANIGNYIDDDLGMKGDRFFLNNINKNEFYIPPTKSLQDFKEQSLNQIEFLKKAIKTEIDNVRDEKELHKNIREIKFKARENAERRLFDDAIYKEHTQAREFYTTQYDEAMQEMQNYYDKKFTNTLNEIDFNAPTKQVKTQMLEALKPIFNQTMTSSDGVQAYMSLKSLSKMTSDKAIQKSIDNGFSREEHLKAVLDIQRLFENAKLAQTHGDNKNLSENVLIHRLNSELENGNALITTKESLDINKNRVYSLELELTPRFNDEMRPTDIKI